MPHYVHIIFNALHKLCKSSHMVLFFALSIEIMFNITKVHQGSTCNDQKLLNLTFWNNPFYVYIFITRTSRQSQIENLKGLI